jgi:hypothetical protein
MLAGTMQRDGDGGWAMKKRQIFWAIAFGSMLAFGAGCGDDGSTGGTGGTGGSGGGPSTSTCEAICSSTCALGGVDPGADFNACVSECVSAVPQYDDECGSEADAYLGCIEANDCDPEVAECQNEAIAWGACLAGI